MARMPEMDAVAISDDQTTVVMHSFRDPYGDGEFVRFNIEMTTDRLRAETEVTHAPYAGNPMLSTFIRDLADSWRGWDGERTWEAMEHQLRITASPGSLSFQLADPARHQWSASASVTVEQGEQMRRFASALAEHA